ncbi:MAG: cytochrome c biogenesis protein CcsA [Dysgonamonadaceae bacterium]|nr:cytochrome c biogenesis protein CcsA [Dysgonamonadaceae bacterium]
MQHFSSKIFTTLWIIVIAVLIAATFVEKYCGSEAAYHYIYGAWWFTVLWALLAAGALFEIYRKKSCKNKAMLLLHLSFIVILAGALCTKIWGERGQIVLQKNSPCITENIALPFTVSLDTFYIRYYAGTNTPADYISEISIESEKAQISMNKIYTYKGYRFYQSSYNDGQISVLSINHDPCGIAVTYAGYALFFLSGLWMMFRTPILRITQVFASKFKKHRKINITFIICILSGFTNVFANNVSTLNETQSRQFGDLWMLYDGRITSVSTFAHDFTLKLTGKSKFAGLNVEQFLSGFLFFPEEWQNVALFKIKDSSLKKLLNAETQNASFADFFDENNNYKLAELPRSKEIDRLNDKIQLINMLHSGTLLQMFPLPQNGELHWYSPTENFPLTEKQENITFVRTILTGYYSALHNNDEAKATAILQQISEFQQNNAGEFLPSETHRNVEIFYLKHNVIQFVFKINLATGILSLLFLFILKNRKWQARFSKLFLLMLIHSFGFLTVSIALRTYISGQLPFATGFETMLLLAWLAMLATLIFRKKMQLALPFGLLISGCALLVAHLGMMNPKITPIIPVLSSPLLSLHVSVIMIAYMLLAFTALNSLIALIALALRKTPQSNAKHNTLLCLRPALFLLGTGIFIGAVWANISWGNYWSWDPKETWALISFLTYSLVLHKHRISPTVFHLFVILAFFSVLITYFGVNYFFGGMHGYG